MDIGVEQKCLGQIDISALRDAILAQPPVAWQEQLSRQQTYEVHRDTESIVLLFCEESWPDGEIYREPGWDRLADVALPLINKVIETWYEPGGTILRIMAAKLKVNGRIRPHRDTLRSFRMGHRVHIPITSSEYVRFTIAGKPFAFEPGNVYELNNQLVHSVVNMGDEDRITFIFDYVPASATW
ncbi:MAG: aspartyl/asparaginyl beta-hydroxylase domain-containing protein [Gammaproteobacteria bacterium]|nr:aspartyl/asparaginyl beta-hydroxylase domain-containing protein [Gammaproteobacteria bacterium]MDH5303690.1 aspartyl/asparaginyl beta-hydroxylase domain-containing protein [Gammaproteobacteria bacterium]MDH5322935.1 aspartyl/asparaginyl beta-hydroxylase domain-containing protein [Gammaproteobacteria bacterium]